MAQKIPSAVLIAGPTASGKSAVAMEIAQRIGGVVVNADSMQVYGDLRILTARPSEADESIVPHRLYGHIAAGQEYTVALWLADLGRVLAEGLVPVIVGGTGLYFKAALEGLVETPPIPPEIRAKWMGQEPEELHPALQALDPVMAGRLKPADVPRLVRALEVVEATGRSLGEWQSQAAKPLIDAETAEFHMILPERAELYRRIDARFVSMIEAGALEEVRGLMAKGLPANRGVMKAHGVPHLIAYLQGEMGLDEAIALGQRDTRRYAKRQMTWARAQRGVFDSH